MHYLSSVFLSLIHIQHSLRFPSLKLALRPTDAGSLARWAHCLTVWVSFLRQSPLIRLEAASDATTLRPGEYQSWGYKKLFSDDWDQLFFKLHDKSLQYFRNEAAADPLGFMDLHSVTSVSVDYQYGACWWLRSFFISSSWILTRG